MKLQITIRRRLIETNHERVVYCETDKLSSAADAAAQEMGFPDWERYTTWSGALPEIITIRELVEIGSTLRAPAEL